MTDNIKKLIKANKWGPIEEAPHEVLVLVGWCDKTFDEWTQEVAMASWGKRSDNGVSNRSFHGQATHFRPLPDDRLAEVCGVLLGALEVIRCGSNSSPATARETDKIVADDALSRANEIAGGTK